MLALGSLVLTALCVMVVLFAAARTRNAALPTLRSLERLRHDLAPALVRVETDRERARALRGRG